MDRELSSLARRLESFRRHPGSSRPRYPGDLRAEVAAVAERAIDAGWSRRQVVDSLGLSAPTVVRWMARESVHFRTVSVVEDEQASTVRRETASLCVVTPGGWRIEGLDLESVRELLEWAR